LTYQNASLEGIHAKILVYLTKISALYSPKNPMTLEEAIVKLEKVQDFCISISDLAQTAFEKNIFEKEKLKVVT
jgi:hypothetical protein